MQGAQLPSPNQSTPSSEQSFQAQRLVPIAPASDQHNGESVEQLMPYTCLTCARRKVKCDKKTPTCSACRKGKLECSYQAPPPRKRKRKLEEDIQARLDRYEKLLKENGLLPEDDSTPAEAVRPGSVEVPVTSPGLLEARPRLETGTGTLLKGPGKTRYVDSNVWRNLGEDLHPSSDEEEAGDPQLSIPKTYIFCDPATSAFYFGPHPPTQDLVPLHPTYANALKLWQQYVRNVDPIIKFIHVPTGLTMVQRAAANPSSVPKVTECLLFAIYHFAVSSSSEQECMELFGQAKSPLQNKYHDALKQALVSCQFLRTTEMAVLQAYVLLLLSVRNILDPHTFWILTGIAVRIAQRMGLHRDGEELGLNPYDVQMRRRLFWQLLPLDGLSAQLCGTGIAIAVDSWDTRQPLNVNDEDIWPGMDTAPMEKKGATDIMFCLARTEIGRFHQKVKPALGNWGRSWETKDLPMLDQPLQEMEEKMEEKYIRYCDISNPIHCLTIAMCRASLNSARLRIRIPRARNKSATPEERKELYALSAKVLDHDIAIHKNQSLNRFHWHLHNFFQWDPLICVLNECSHPEPAIDVEAAWLKVGQVFHGHPDLLSQKRSLDAALARLATRSWDATQTRRRVPMPEPSFISSIRLGLQRRESLRHPTETMPRNVASSFDAAGNAGDVPALNYLQAQTGAGYMNFEMPGDWNSDLDWVFWDQLTQNPEGGDGARGWNGRV